MPPEPSQILRPDWPSLPTVQARVTTRDGFGQSLPPFARANLGIACGDEVETVLANRQQLVHSLGLPSAPHWLQQVHGVAVHRVTGSPPGPMPAIADAAVTGIPGQVLAILTADCLPVLLAARDGSQVGAAHAGWRGLAAGVLEATVAAMGIAPDQLIAWLGPCIGLASYEVGVEVRDTFAGHAAEAEAAFVATRPGHWLADLALLARQRLQAAGVAAISGGGFDTGQDPRFYSYRRDAGRTGRFASLIWLQ